jgi:ectoine hydroxylase-related dioxygenase (phytanoyl-CoA dioxygenase family)
MIGSGGNERGGSMQLSQEQIADFNREGYLLVKDLFCGQELSHLSAAADRVIEEGLRGVGRDHGHTDESDPTTYFRSEGMLDRDPAFLLAAANPDLLRCVGQCLGQPFLLMNDRMVTKQAYTGVPVEWHQDPPYLGQEGRSETFPVPNFVADIHLDETNEENGCLHVLAGRHLCGRVDWSRATEEELFCHPDSRPILAEPGDVSFHALSIPHGSRANRGPKKRRLLLYHYVCRAVYDDHYAGWMILHGGYGTENVQRLRKMRKAREDLGWPANFSDVAFTEDGIEYRGEIRQSRDGWAKLLADISSSTLDALRTVRQQVHN